MKKRNIPTIAYRDQRDRGASADGQRLFVGMEVERTFRIEKRAVGEGGQVAYAASISSSAIVDRGWYREVLVHTPEAVNLDRAAANGLALLYNHDTGRPLGRARDLKLVDGFLRSDNIQFSSRPEAQGFRQDVEDEMLSDISVRYSIDAYNESTDKNGDLMVTVSRWTPLEVSVVPVPADHTVGFGRSLEGRRDRTSGDNVDELDEWRRKNGSLAEQERQAGQMAERNRMTGIAELFGSRRFSAPEFQALRRELEQSGASIEKAQRALLRAIDEETGIGGSDERGHRQAPIDGRQDDRDRQRHVRVEAGTDDREKARTAALAAFEVRSGIIDQGGMDLAARRSLQAAMAQNPFRGMTMVEMTRELLRVRGINTVGLSHYDLVKYGLQPWLAPDGSRDYSGGMGTSDLVYVLENNMNKGLTKGWTEAPETWQQIVRIGNLNDFKAGTRTNYGAVSSLQTVLPNGEYKYSTVTDVKEPIQLGKKGALVALSFEAIVNDDLDAFSRIPIAMGRAASRAVGDGVYSLLTSNAALTQDGVALFHTSAVPTGHANIASSGAPSVARLDEMDRLMAVQKSPGAAESGGLNTELALLIVPRALKGTAMVLAAAQYDPAGLVGTLPPNRWSQAFRPVSDARLDATSTSVYYGSADPNLHDTLDLAFLDGVHERLFDAEGGWRLDGMEYRVVRCFAPAVLDYRDLVCARQYAGR